MLACGDDAAPARHAAPVPPQSRAVADPSVGIDTPLDGPARDFNAALVAELTGDTATAQAGYTRVLDAKDASPRMAELAAIHLARMESHAGHAQAAAALAARAVALAPSDPLVGDVLVELHEDGTGVVRGPALGQALPGAAPDLAAAWSAAEAANAVAHRLRIRVSFVALTAPIRAKESAVEDAVAKYRAIADRGGVAQVAARYRAGSLYYDLASSLLLVELPSELAPAAEASLRSTLRTRALRYLDLAATEFREALASPPSAEAELWQVAAEKDLKEVAATLGK